MILDQSKILSYNQFVFQMRFGAKRYETRELATSL